MGSPLITVALCVLLAALLVDLVCIRLPTAWVRRRDTRRLRPRAGRDEIAAVEVLAPGTWTPLPAPRRGAPRPEITVEAVLGIPQLRAIGPFERAGVPTAHVLRRVGGRGGVSGVPHRALVVESWDAATRGQARLVDAAAVQLGLARDELHPAPSTDPDPLLTSATWSARRADAPRRRRRRAA
jgi:hypothetical protein